MEELVEIGRTSKSHGLQGGIRFDIRDEYIEDFLSVEVVFIEQKGQPVPYFIEEVKGVHLVVELEGIKTKEAATELAKKKVFIRKESLIPEDQKMFVAEGLEYEPYVGYMVEEATLGEIGKILEIVEYPQQELALIEYKEKEILIPLNDTFIKGINDADQKIFMSLPEDMIAIQL